MGPCDALGGGGSPRSGVFWGRDGEGEDIFLFLRVPGWGGVGWASTERGNKCSAETLGQWVGVAGDTPGAPPCAFLVWFDCFLAQEHPGEVGGGGRLSWRV